MSDSGGVFSDIGRPNVGRATLTMSDTSGQVIIVAVDDSAPSEYAITCKCRHCAGVCAGECVCACVCARTRPVRV